MKVASPAVAGGADVQATSPGACPAPTKKVTAVRGGMGAANLTWDGGCETLVWLRGAFWTGVARDLRGGALPEMSANRRQTLGT